MKKGVLYTAMQIGSNSIKTITSTIGRNGNIQVIGFGNSNPTTLNDDLETNNELLNTSIKTSLSKGQRYIGKKVKNAFVVKGGYNGSTHALEGSSGEDGKVCQICGHLALIRAGIWGI